MDELASRVKLPLVVAIATDFSSYSCHHEDPDWLPFSAVIGLLVTATDAPCPCPVDFALLEQTVGRSNSLPWDEVKALLGPIDERGSELDTESRLWAVATGPLAGLSLAFGVPAVAPGESLEAPADGPRAREPALEFLAGRDIEERRVNEGIWGVPIARNGDWEYGTVDATPSAHQRHLAKLGTLANDARYYLMACCD